MKNEMKCRDCGVPMGIPVEYNKRSKKPKTAKRCKKCFSAMNKRYAQKYKCETLEEEEKRLNAPLIDISDEPIVNQGGCDAAKAIYNRIFKSDKRKLTRQYIPVAFDRSDLDYVMPNGVL